MSGQAQTNPVWSKVKVSFALMKAFCAAFCSLNDKNAVQTQVIIYYYCYCTILANLIFCSCQGQPGQTTDCATLKLKKKSLWLMGLLRKMGVSNFQA